MEIAMQPFTLGGDRALEAHARALEAASGDYRVLRRLLRPEELWLTPSQHGTQTVLGIVGTETTGLNDDARLIELSIVKLVIGIGSGDNPQLSYSFWPFFLAK